MEIVLRDIKRDRLAGVCIHGKDMEISARTCSVFQDWEMVARERFELSSAGPKPAMLGHYTTGLRMHHAFKLTF